MILDGWTMIFFIYIYNYSGCYVFVICGSFPDNTQMHSLYMMQRFCRNSVFFHIS